MKLESRTGVWLIMLGVGGCVTAEPDERTETAASELSDALPTNSLNLIRIEPENKPTTRSGDAAFAGADNYAFTRTTSGDYAFRSIQSGQCLDHGEAGAGAAVAHRLCDGRATQQFRAVQLSPNTYRLVGGQGACLAWNYRDGLTQAGCDATSWQRFRITPAPQVRIRVGRWNKCLDVEAGSTSAGARVHQWECHGGDNQRFFPMQFGTDWVFFAAHSGGCLALAASGDVNGTALVQENCSAAAWFRFSTNDHGFEIQAASVSKCLDRDGVDNPQNGARVQLWACGSTENQSFRFEEP